MTNGHNRILFQALRLERSSLSHRCNRKTLALQLHHAHRDIYVYYDNTFSLKIPNVRGIMPVCDKRNRRSFNRLGNI